MFLDLNVSWPGNAREAAALVAAAASLGFSGVAFNVQLDLAVESPKTHKCPFNDADVAAMRPVLGHSSKKHFKAREGLSELQLSCFRGDEVSASEDAHRFLVLRRLTVTVNNQNETALLNSLSRQLADQYDILAVRPKDERTYMNVLREGEFDILVLDFEESRMPFKLRRPQLGLCVSRGSFVEVSLGVALRDANKRRALFANMQPVIRFVPHGHIVVTSGARDPLELRGPHDIANAAEVMGIRGTCEAKAVVGEAAVGVLFKGASRRLGGGIVGVLSKESTAALSASGVEQHRRLMMDNDDYTGEGKEDNDDEMGRGEDDGDSADDTKCETSLRAVFEQELG